MKSKYLLGGIIAAASIIAAVIILTVLYNRTFPQKYIEKNFPNIKVNSTSTRSPGLFEGGDIISGSYLTYECYDEENGLPLELVFYKDFFKPVYSDPDTTEYDNSLYHINHSAELCELISDTVGGYEEEYFVRANFSDCIDSRTSFGYCIFVPRQSTENLSGLIAAIDEFNRGRRAAANEYITYSVFVCMDDEIYASLKNADFSNAHGDYTGQAYFDDVMSVLDCKTERITASGDGFDADIYENLGDRSDSEYKDPTSFEHLIFWYDGEPNANGSGNFHLFGVDMNE